MIQAIKDFFQDRVHGRDRVLLFLVIPPIILLVGGLIFVEFRRQAPPPLPDRNPVAPRPYSSNQLDIEELQKRLGNTELQETVALEAHKEVPAEVFEQFLEITGSNPESARAWAGLGRSLLRAGKSREALAALNRACELEMLNARYLADRAVARRGNSDNPGALADLVAAQRLDTRNVIVSNRLLLRAVETKDDALFDAKLASIQTDLNSGADARTIVGVAAREIRLGNTDNAVDLIKQAKDVMTLDQLRTLLADPFFQDRRGQLFLEKLNTADTNGPPLFRSLQP